MICSIFGHFWTRKTQYVPYAYGYSASGILYEWFECQVCKAKRSMVEIR